MIKSVTIIVFCLVASCVNNRNIDNHNKYIVETVVHIQPGMTKAVLELFKSTNPDLVSDQPDWIKASFSEVEAKNIVVVRAEWRSRESYLAFSNSKKFKETMSGFGMYFTDKPQITISKVLFEM